MGQHKKCWEIWKGLGTVVAVVVVVVAGGGDDDDYN